MTVDIDKLLFGTGDFSDFAEFLRKERMTPAQKLLDAAQERINRKNERGAMSFLYLEAMRRSGVLKRWEQPASNVLAYLEPEGRA